MSKFVSLAGEAILFLFLGVVSSSHASQPSRDCVKTHMADAIRINGERSVRYSALSQGKSEQISEALIAMERSLLRTSFLLDIPARYFQSRGVPLFCTELKDMETIPKFSDSFSEPPRSEAFLAVDISAMRSRLRYAWKRDGLSGLEGQAREELAPLFREVRLNCLLRHNLESIVAVAHDGLRHQAEAKEKGIWFDPKWLTEIFLQGHLWYLEEFHRIDQMAKDLQLKGLPILCQDIPKIL